MKLTFFLVTLLLAPIAQARFQVSPYVSVTSTKSIKADRTKSKETETIKQRQEAGIRAGLSFYRLFKLNLSVGQSVLTTTAKENELVDEYEEINFDNELDTSTDNPDIETKTRETQNKARLSVIFDPGFWIFIARLKAGVIARQRIVEIFQNDVLLSKVDPGITYKPTAGFGLGVKLTPRMFFMIEYGFYFFKFPEPAPLEREATISYSISI